MANSRPTQCRRILDYLEKHGSITQYEALTELGIMRLASRVSELRKHGYCFVCDWANVTNRYDEPCRVKRYRLRETDKGGGD